MDYQEQKEIRSLKHYLLEFFLIAISPYMESLTENRCHLLLQTSLDDFINQNETRPQLYANWSNVW